MPASDPVPNPTPPSASSKPWPMKWIAFAILVYMFLQVLYLFISTR